MAFPGPPGVSNKISHQSLPPRPPPSQLSSGFKPAFSTAAPAAAPSYATAPSGYPASTTSYSSAPSYGPQYGPSAPGTTRPYNQPASSSIGGGSRSGYYGTKDPPTQYGGYAQNSGQQSHYGADHGPAAPSSSYAAPPQIRNPFPQPGAQGDYDLEMAAQIAQWQSAYMPKENIEAPTTGKGGAGAGGRTGGAFGGGAAQGAAAAGTDAANANNKDDPTALAGGVAGQDKKKTVYREGGGKKWADESLLEWDPSHLRLFVGNLAGETTDDSLLKAFSRWASVQRAKVVRDKRTTKSKGYGFVSFSDPDDFFQAAKEMNGKYIQSHPVVVRKSTTEIKVQTARESHHGKGGKNQKKGGKQSGNGVSTQLDGGASGSGGYDAHLGPVRSGVTKPGQKTKGGLKLLG